MKKFLILLLAFCFLAIPSLAQEEATTFNTDELNIQDNVVSYKTYKIISVDPQNVVEQKKDGLVIYTSLYGKTTNSDTKGIEAVVVDNKVIKINQNNSYIPQNQNGFVISGHGKAKKFILENMFEGVNVDIDFEKSLLKVETHQENYIYEASYRIENMKKILETANADEINVENMQFYINRAEDILNRTKKMVYFKDYDTAKRMAQDSITYADMAQYSSLVYKADEFKAIWVFPYQKNTEEVKQAYEVIHRLGIDNIFVDVYYNGETVYPSEVAQKYGMNAKHHYYGDFDVLQAWIDIAKENNKKIYVSLKPFDVGNPAKSTIKEHITSVHPSWKNRTVKKTASNDNLYLDIANAEVQQYNIELIKELIAKYQIDGINISGLAYPAYNLNQVKNSWGYTDFAQKEFKKIYNVNPKTLSKKDKNWADWENYKENKVTEFANKVIALATENPELEFSFDIKVDGKDFSQNIAKWNLNENIIILPVLNSSDSDFVKDFLSQIKLVSSVKKIYPIYYDLYLEEKPRRLFDQISVARDLEIKGLILYDLDYLTKEYYDALKLSLFLKPDSEENEKESLFKKEFSNDEKEQTTENIEKE